MRALSSATGAVLAWIALAHASRGAPPPQAPEPPTWYVARCCPPQAPERPIVLPPRRRVNAVGTLAEYNACGQILAGYREGKAVAAVEQANLLGLTIRRHHPTALYLLCTWGAHCEVVSMLRGIARRPDVWEYVQPNVDGPLPADWLTFPSVRGGDPPAWAGDILPADVVLPPVFYPPIWGAPIFRGSFGGGRRGGC